jgi:HEPN domain-containing protein
MTVRDEATRLARGWAAKAEEDLLAAEHLLALGDECPFGIVAFHSQQCAEKYVKAVLTLRSVPFPRTHDLLELSSMVPPDAGLRVSREEIALLNRYSVEVRYPGEWEPVTRADARSALVAARGVKESVLAILAGLLQEPDPP